MTFTGVHRALAGPVPVPPAAYAAAVKAKLERDRKSYAAFRAADQAEHDKAHEQRVTAAVAAAEEDLRLWREDLAEVEPEAAEALAVFRAAEDRAMDEGGEDAARRQRDRVQHEAEPYYEAPDVDCVDVGELGKLRTQAVDVPTGYPPMRPMDAEQFRRGPATAGHAADSPGWSPPGRPVPVPSATLSPGMITRPLLSDGQSRPCAPEAC